MNKATLSAVAICLSTAGAVSLLPSTAYAVATATVTKQVKAGTSLNVRTGPGTSYATVGKLAGGTKVTGTLSGSWFKITSGSYAGKYVAATYLVAPTTDTPTPRTLTGWAGYTKTLTTTRGVTIPAGTKLTGRLSGNEFVISSGPYSGKHVSKYDVMWTDMAYALRGNASKPSSKAPVGQTVTRYLIDALDYSPAVRSEPRTHSTLVARVPKGSSFTGQYVSAAWFKITSGAQAGRYISADLLHTSSRESANNGQIPSADLCEVPAWMNTTWAPKTPRTLQCNALDGLLKLNTAFKAKFGYDLTLDEGYRDLHTQDMYHEVYASGRAAIPGTSNHGYGRAMDLLGTRTAQLEGRKASPYTFSSPADQWLTVNSTKYGWDRPEVMDARGTNPEYWHYNWIG